MDQLSITNQIHCCTHSELAEEAIQLSDTRHVLVSVHVTGGVVTSSACRLSAVLTASIVV